MAGGSRSSRLCIEHVFTYAPRMRTWERDDPYRTRPIAAPLEQCAQLLGIDLAAIRAAAATVAAESKVYCEPSRSMTCAPSSRARMTPAAMTVSASQRLNDTAHSGTP